MSVILKLTKNDWVAYPIHSLLSLCLLLKSVNIDD